MPIAAVIQIDAAVVRPRNREAFLDDHAGAGEKPMPVMMPCAIARR